MYTRCFCVSAVALCLLVAGCGGGRVVKVKGRVTLDDQPVAGATVVFNPLDANGKPATGLTDDDGYFTLQTFKPDDGALPGEYRVTVTKTEALAGGEQFTEGMDPSKITDMMKKMSGGVGPKQPSKPKSRLPAIYGDDKKTPLKVTVPVEGELILPLKKSAGGGT